MAEVEIKIKGTDAATPAIKNVKTGLDQLKDKATEVSGAFKQVSELAQGMFAGMMGAAGVMAITDGLKRLAIAAIETSDQLERFHTMMNRLMGSTQAGGEAIQWVADLANRMGVSVATLTSSFMKMQSTGLDPMKGSMETIIDTVMAFGGSSSEIDRVTVALTQMAGKGVVSAEELRQQLAEVIPTAAKDMAEGLGMSLTDFFNKMSTGGITATAGLSAMLQVWKEKFGGASEEMGNLFSSSMSRITNLWAEFIDTLRQEGAFEPLKKQLESIIAKLTELGTSGALKALAENISLATKVAGPFLSVFIELESWYLKGILFQINTSLKAIALVMETIGLTKKKIETAGDAIELFDKKTTALENSQDKAFQSIDGVTGAARSQGAQVNKLASAYSGVITKTDDWNVALEKELVSIEAAARAHKSMIEEIVNNTKQGLEKELGEIVSWKAKEQFELIKGTQQWENIETLAQVKILEVYKKAMSERIALIQQMVDNYNSLSATAESHYTKSNSLILDAYQAETKLFQIRKEISASDVVTRERSYLAALYDTSKTAADYNNVLQKTMSFLEKYGSMASSTSIEEQRFYEGASKLADAALQNMRNIAAEESAQGDVYTQLAARQAAWIDYAISTVAQYEGKIQELATQIDTAFARQYGVNVDITDAYIKLEQVKAYLDSIPAVTTKIIRIQTVYSSGGGGGGENVENIEGSWQHGTSYVPKTGTYRLHEGEAVMTASEFNDIRNTHETNNNKTIAPSFHITQNVYGRQGASDTDMLIKRIKKAMLKQRYA